jgi:cytidine deaminase
VEAKKVNVETTDPAVTVASVEHIACTTSTSSDSASRNELHRKLLDHAREAAKRSYSPYSHFPVGAAILTKDGRIFTGCNVENASYGGAICAERTAMVKAVSEGFTEFEVIAVICSKAKDAWPCGFCRQFICEFGAHIEVVTEGEDGSPQSLKIIELLPKMFGPSSLVR